MQLEAKNIGFKYGRNDWLFQGVNFTVSPGEIVGLQGPSGRGKTTFCRILAGYEEALEGQVTLGGDPISRKGLHPVQLVFQHPEKAVNMRWKMKKVLEETGAIDPSLLSLLGIEPEWMDRWPGELSGGELQRFCVVRALQANPKFLIADEMTTMLDAITQAQIWNAVLDVVKARNMGMIVVSHEQKLMTRLCDRIVTL